MSGFTATTRAAILERDGGRCWVCGKQAAQIHHRKPRGMGGSTDPNISLACNGLLVCGVGGTDGCHGWIESHREWAVTRGYLVPRSMDSQQVPVQRWGQTWWLLDTEGGKQHLKR